MSEETPSNSFSEAIADSNATDDNMSIQLPSAIPQLFTQLSNTNPTNTNIISAHNESHSVPITKSNITNIPSNPIRRGPNLNLHNLTRRPPPPSNIRRQNSYENSLNTPSFSPRPTPSFGPTLSRLNTPALGPASNKLPTIVNTNITRQSSLEARTRVSSVVNTPNVTANIPNINIIPNSSPNMFALPPAVSPNNIPPLILSTSNSISKDNTPANSNKHNDVDDSKTTPTSIYNSSLAPVVESKQSESKSISSMTTSAVLAAAAQANSSQPPIPAMFLPLAMNLANSSSLLNNNNNTIFHSDEPLYIPLEKIPIAKRTIKDILGDVKSGFESASAVERKKKAKEKLIEAKKKKQKAKEAKENNHGNTDNDNKQSDESMGEDSEEESAEEKKQHRNSNHNHRSGNSDDEDYNLMASVSAPRMRVDELTGRLVLVEDSLIVNAPPIRDRSSYEVVYESSNRITSATYTNRESSEKWSESDSAQFFRCLAMFGCDFTLISQMFPNRTRKQIKLKFKREERLNKALVEAAIKKRIPINTTEFEAKRKLTEEVAGKKNNNSNNTSTNTTNTNKKKKLKDGEPQLVANNNKDNTLDNDQDNKAPENKSPEMDTSINRSRNNSKTITSSSFAAETRQHHPEYGSSRKGPQKTVDKEVQSTEYNQSKSNKPKSNSTNSVDPVSSAAVNRSTRSKKNTAANSNLNETTTTESVSEDVQIIPRKKLPVKRKH